MRNVPARMNQPADTDKPIDRSPRNAIAAIFEFRYDIAGWPKRVESRDALMSLYRGYGEGIVLHGGDGLVVHRCDDGHVIVIEYEVHGRVVGSGAAYENRFVSIVTVENRQIVHWRDYMDSLAAMRALSTKI